MIARKGAGEMFNDKITREDIAYLDNLYKTAYSAEDTKFWADESERIIGSLEDPEEMIKYLRKIEELYGKKEDDK